MYACLFKCVDKERKYTHTYTHTQIYIFTITNCQMSLWWPISLTFLHNTRMFIYLFLGGFLAKKYHTLFRVDRKAFPYAYP